MKVVYGLMCFVFSYFLLSARYENLETLSPSQAMLVLSCAIALLSIGFFLIVLGVASRKSKWRDQLAEQMVAEQKKQQCEWLSVGRPDYYDD